MIKVKFTGITDFTSKGINFINGGVYDLKPEVVEYLKNTFDNIEILEVAKDKAKEVVTDVLEVAKDKAKEVVTDVLEVVVEEAKEVVTDVLEVVVEEAIKPKK